MVGTGVLDCKSVRQGLLSYLLKTPYVTFKLGAVLLLLHVGSLHTVLFHRQRSANMWQ